MSVFFNIPTSSTLKNFHIYFSVFAQNWNKWTIIYLWCDLVREHQCHVTFLFYLIPYLVNRSHRDSQTAKMARSGYPSVPDAIQSIEYRINNQGAGNCNQLIRFVILSIPFMFLVFHLCEFMNRRNGCLLIWYGCVPWLLFNKCMER